MSVRSLTGFIETSLGPCVGGAPPPPSPARGGCFREGCGFSWQHDGLLVATDRGIMVCPSLIDKKRE